jgi:guanine nucleotide-binding protein G(i) subunit alpha
MGLCASSSKPLDKDSQAASQALDNKLANDHQEDKHVNKLLLLGAGESGKSTLFKQMITIYGKGFNEAERASFVSIIHNNILTSMKTLIKYSATYGPVQPSNERAKAVIEDLKGDEEIKADYGAQIAALWADPGIQATYAARVAFQLTDSAKYFFDKIKEVSANGYLPSQQDVLRSRVRTTGIVENDFEIDGNKFKMYDVGGQRNERKKWIHCFENVTAVLFVAAISEYDQVLYEDENTNRMAEALNLFEDICNNRWFQRTSMILMLNKRDLFADKIVKVPLTVCFPDYDGPQTYEAGVEFIRNQFESKNHSAEKHIYTHVTCATDTGNVQAVFNAVKDIIIRMSLNEAGL